MKRIISLFLLLTLAWGVKGQTQDCSVVLNHFLIVVDSTTYEELLVSEVLNSDFAFAYERNKNWEGIYIIGKDNYIEIFHPKSVADEDIPIGFTWICQSSLVANCIENYSLPYKNRIAFTTDEDFDYLSVYTQDSLNLFTTWEMNKRQYESWTKKSYHDSLEFITTDYNSPAESDSSNNYLFNNVTGIEVNLNTVDSLPVTQYLKLIGYTPEKTGGSKVRFTNSIDFIELTFSENIEMATISSIYFKLNKPTVTKQIIVGNSEITLEGNTGLWKINN